MALLRVASVKEMSQPGKMIRVKSDGNIYVLINSDSKLYCMDGLCTHKACQLNEGKLTDSKLACPCHGAEFDVRTGNVVKNVFPPQYGLATNTKTYRVLVQDDDIFIDI